MENHLAYEIVPESLRSSDGVDTYTITITRDGKDRVRLLTDSLATYGAAHYLLETAADPQATALSWLGIEPGAELTGTINGDIDSDPGSMMQAQVVARQAAN